MKQFILQERDGLPFTARVNWGWYLALFALTTGWVAIALGFYLSCWIRGKQKRGIAVYAYIFLSGLFFLAFLPDRFLPIGLSWGVLAAAIGVLWYFAAFLLRREIIRYYLEADGTRLRINPLWVVLFSVVYLNCCLRVAPSPVIGRSNGANVYC